MTATAPTVAWVTGNTGTGISAQSKVVTDALHEAGHDVQLVVGAALGTNHSGPYIRDEGGVVYPTGNLADALLALDPEIVVFHSATQEIRAATTEIQPHAITCVRLGVNFREQMLAGEQFAPQIPALIDWLQGIDHLVPSSPRVRRAMRCHGVDAERMTHIPTCIDASECRDPAETGSPADAPTTVGMIGRLCKVKNQLTVLEGVAGLRAVGNAPPMAVHMAGRQSQRDGFVEALRGLLAELVPNFQTRLLGYVDDPMADFYPHVDVHAHPSWTENCPQTILEAAVAGVPTVASDMAWADAYPELDVPTCPPDDPWAWTEAIHDLATDADYRERLARQQQTAVCDHYAASVVVPRYAHLFEHLQDEHSAFKIDASTRSKSQDNTVNTPVNTHG